MLLKYSKVKFLYVYLFNVYFISSKGRVTCFVVVLASIWINSILFLINSIIQSACVVFTDCSHVEVTLPWPYHFSDEV